MMPRPKLNQTDLFTQLDKITKQIRRLNTLLPFGLDTGWLTANSVSNVTSVSSISAYSIRRIGKVVYFECDFSLLAAITVPLTGDINPNVTLLTVTDSQFIPTTGPSSGQALVSGGVGVQANFIILSDGSGNIQITAVNSMAALASGTNLSVSGTWACDA